LAGWYHSRFPGVVRKIAAAARLEPGWPVLEIGGGAGALSGALLDAGAALTIVEMDDEWAAHLESQYGGLPGFRVVHADATQVGWSDLLRADPARPVKVVANLPYNRPVEILLGLVEGLPAWSEMILMFQKEVAQRVVAGPGGKTYGSLPLALWPHATAARLFDVSPTCFRPRPKVTSTVIRVLPRPSPLLEGEALARYLRLVRAAFAHRRKTLLNSLSRAQPDAVDAARAALVARGLPETTRPEQLPPDFYGDLAR